MNCKEVDKCDLSLLSSLSLAELKSTLSGRWIAYRQKVLVTQGFSMTWIWHNLPWAVSLGMTNVVCLWNPIKRFFFLKTEIVPSAPPACIWGILLFARLSREIWNCQKEHGTESEVFCVSPVCMCAHVLLQEEALWFLCSKGQFSSEVAHQSLSLGEEEVGVVRWGHAKFAQNTHCTGRSPQLLRTQCKYGQPHSSWGYLPQHMSKVQRWFSACSWNCTMFLQNSGVWKWGGGNGEAAGVTEREGLISGFWEQERRVTRVRSSSRPPLCFNFSFLPKFIGFGVNSS